MPIATGAAAVVVCHGVLHNVIRIELLADAVRELRRVLSNDGNASLRLFTSRHVDARLTAIGEHRYRLPDGQIMTLLPPATIADLCHASGLTIIDGPHEYQHEADRGLQSVWRAVLRPQRV